MHIFKHRKVWNLLLIYIILLSVLLSISSIEKVNAQTDERVIYFVSPEGSD